MARRYVRDSEGRFAHVSGVGQGIVHVKGDGTFAGTNAAGERKFFDNEPDATRHADSGGSSSKGDGIRTVEHKVPVMQRGLNYSVGHTTEKRYHVEGGPPEGFKNRAEAQRWQQRHSNNPSASYSQFSTGHKAEPLRTDNRGARAEEARLQAVADARRAARQKVAEDNPVSDDAKAAARKAAKAERARKRRAAARESPGK